MDPVLFLAFLTATLLIVATPGPSVALASAQAIRFGPRAALTTVAGDALGSVVHILIAVGSLKTLIALSGVILPWLQMAGGVFILWLALQSWREARIPAPDLPPLRKRASFATGFFACVTNPKAIVFFVALFPGFISAEHSITLQSLVYGVIFVTLDAAFILGYALLAMHAVRTSMAQKIRIEHLSAVGLCAVGILMLIRGYRALGAA